MGLIDNVRKSLFLTADEALHEALWASLPRDFEQLGKFREEVARRAKAALARGADPNRPLTLNKLGTDWTCSPLGRAIYIDAAGLVEALLDSGAVVDVVGLNQCIGSSPVKSTALGLAISRDSTHNVETLLARGASTSLVDESGGSALCFLAHRFDPVRYSPILFALWTVKALINAGADLNAVDRDGDTPLHIAARGGNSRLVRELVAAGANLEVRDKLGRTPLMALSASLFLQHPEVRSSHDSDWRMWRIVGDACIQALLDGGADARAVDSEGRCSLRLMEHAPTASWIKALVAAGANPNAVAADGLSPLSAAVSHARTPMEMRVDEGRPEDKRMMSCEVVFDEGCAEMVRLAKSVECLSDFGEPLVVAAARRGRVATVEALAARGVDLEARGDDGDTLLLGFVKEAAPKGDMSQGQAMSRILSLNVNLAAADEKGLTSLHWAEKHGVHSTHLLKPLMLALLKPMRAEEMPAIAGADLLTWRDQRAGALVGDGKALTIRKLRG